MNSDTSHTEVFTSTSWETEMLVLVTRGINSVLQWDDVKCYDMHTKFLDDRFRYASNIKGNMSTIWEAAVFVLLTRGSCEVGLVMTPDGKTCILNFLIICWDIQAILKLLHQHFEGLQCWYYWWEGFMKYVAEKDTSHTIYIRNFIKSATGFRIMLGFV